MSELIDDKAIYNLQAATENKLDNVITVGGSRMKNDNVFSDLGKIEPLSLATVTTQK